MDRKIFVGYQVIGYFLAIAVLIVLMAGLSLLMPETFWRQIWFIKKDEYHQMLPDRILIGCGFSLLALIMAFAAIGWFRKKRWAWILTIGIFLINGLSDGVRLIMDSYVEGIIGVFVSAVVIYFLTRSSVKNIFY